MNQLTPEAAIKRLIREHSIEPLMIASDNDTQFTSNAILGCAKGYGIDEQLKT